MHSQTFSDEIVVPKSVVKPRVRSAYMKLDNTQSLINFKTDGSYRSSYDPYDSDDCDVTYADMNKKNPKSKITAIMENQGYYNRRRRDSTSSNEEEIPKPTARQIVNEKNLSYRIKELERTNLNLKRMLDLVANDPSRSLDMNKNPSAPRPSLQRSLTLAESPQGPPQLRQGRIGSSWRHIKQTNNYTNSNLLFIDGTVRINDSARYPPGVYGYPPKFTDYNSELNGLNTQSLEQLNLPVQHYIRRRPMNLSAYDNQFADRAKKGFEYWNKDRKLPENNKTKAKLYTTGAYKTFYGLSDSILKT